MTYSHISDLEGHAGAVYSLLLSDDKQTLYSGGSDGMVGSWDIPSGAAKPFSVKTGEAILSMLIDNNSGRMLIGQSAGGIHVIDTAEKRELRHLKYHGLGVFQMMIHPSEPILLALGGDGMLSVMDVESYKLHMSIPLSHTKLRVMLADAAGVHLLIGGSDGYIRILETGYYNELDSLLAHEGGTYAMAWITPELLVTGGRDGHLRFWIYGDGKLEQEMAVAAHNYAIYDIAVHPDGKHFATASRDKTIKIWPVEDLKHPLRIARDGKVGHTHSVNRVVWIGNSGRLASAGDDKKIRIWQVEF